MFYCCYIIMFIVVVYYISLFACIARNIMKYSRCIAQIDNCNDILRDIAKRFKQHYKIVSLIFTLPMTRFTQIQYR